MSTAWLRRLLALTFGFALTAVLFQQQGAAAAPVAEKAHGSTRSAIVLGTSGGASTLGGGTEGNYGYECTNCYYKSLYLHLPAELQAAIQLEWKQNGGYYIPLRFRLEYCRTPGSDCDTVSGNLRTDGTVEITTPLGQRPYASCPSLAAPLIKKISVDNFDWSAGCIGQTGSSDFPCIIDTDWDLDVLTRVFYPDGTKCLWRIGLNQHSDADAKFTQHDLGQCGVGDYTMTLNTPWTWLYGETEYCYRYQFQ